MQEHKSPERNIANYFLRTGRYVDVMSHRHAEAAPVGRPGYTVEPTDRD